MGLGILGVSFILHMIKACELLKMVIGLMYFQGILLIAPQYIAFGFIHHLHANPHTHHAVCDLALISQKTER